MKRSEIDRVTLVRRMAETLRPLSNDMLESGTARWGVYERARLVNFGTKPKPNLINSSDGGIPIYTALDRAAVDLEKERRGWAAVVRDWNGR